MRALIHLLSVHLFGEARKLPDFPVYRNIRGLGLSDDPCYAVPLAAAFDYTNTYYDRDPYFDITAEHSGIYGTYDFILSSDVFEHVAPPVERAFEEACKLLKPDGVLCVTVPSSPNDEDSREYYPDLNHFSIVDLGGERVLVNRRSDNGIDIHRDLEFHGGIGATLVMRLFSQNGLKCRLQKCGFTEVIFQEESFEPSGIVLPGKWSLPLVARKAPYSPRIDWPPAALGDANTPESARAPGDAKEVNPDKIALEYRVVELERQLRLAADSRWLKLGNRLGLGPRLS